MNNIITRGLGLYQSLIAQGYDLYISIPTVTEYRSHNATGAIQDITPDSIKKYVKDLIDTKKIVIDNNKKDIEVEVFLVKDNIRISVEEQEQLQVPIKIKVTI